MATVEIPCNFVGRFKVGDNLSYNCRVLCDLVEANEDDCFAKMIVLQAGAILEAAMIEVIYRAQQFNLEGVPNIVEEDRLKIEDTTIEKFAIAIDILRKYQVWDAAGPDIYEEMHRLRKYRNKIHIQERVKIVGAPDDEDALFTDEIATWSLALLRRGLEFLSTDLSRPQHIQGYVAALSIPT